MAENLRVVAKSISRISKRCRDSNLQCFDRWFDEFANSGHDRHGWLLSSKDMEAKNKKMDKYLTITATLYKEMEELSTIENSLRKSFRQYKEYESSIIKEQKVYDLQQRQEVEYLKERSLWNRSFDMVVSMLVRSIFTILGRIKLVFGIDHGYPPPSLPRILSASATVHPAENPSSYNFVSEPSKSSKHHKENKDLSVRYFDPNSEILKPLPSTLAAAGLALHYANLIIIIEKMIKSPQLVGIQARDDLYSMLPSSIRSSLRARLKV